jgi:hypothetical protein
MFARRTFEGNLSLYCAVSSIITTYPTQQQNKSCHVYGDSEFTTYTSLCHHYE